MLFDSTLLFYHTGSVFNLTAGEFVSLVGVTAGSASSVINLGNARDLGIGNGAEVPNVVVSIGTAVTSSLATMTLNIQFQGSTDSSAWTTYMETGAQTTTGFAANSGFAFPVPRRTPGAALPQYYRLNFNVAGTNGTAGISTGTIFAGIVLDPAEALTLGQYPAGFTVA